MNDQRQYLKEKDSVLSQIIDKTEIVLHENRTSIFEDLCSCILDMQIHHRGLAVRYKRLKERIQHSEITPEIIFQLSAEDLKYINMSAQKMNALSALANFWIEHKANEMDWNTMTDDEIRVFLKSIKGIGD